jgi:hypothetical protein
MAPMTTEMLVPVRIDSVSGASHLSWAEGMRFYLPHSILERIRPSKYLDKDGDLVIPREIPYIISQAPEALRFRAAFTDKKPLSSRLPVSYQTVPPRLRNLVASVIGRWKSRFTGRLAGFPRWPLDLSADFLADLANGTSSPFASGRTPVLLTHDLDSAEGLENLVKWFLDMEDSFGVRSTNFIVPCAWPFDYNLLDQVKGRGHEIGVHGYDHSNLTPFLDPLRRRDRLESANELIERYNIVGYRSPSLLRTRNLLRDLANFYRYDSSIPTSGGLFPVPNNGCASARPFWVGEIAELPLTMPRDGSLRFLGHSSHEILDIWINCAKGISRSGGVVVLLTHCEARFSGNASMLNTYRSFLDFVDSSKQFVWSNPREILSRALDIEARE